jgi:hypothetical protein
MDGPRTLSRRGALDENGDVCRSDGGRKRATALRVTEGLRRRELPVVARIGVV